MEHQSTAGPQHIDSEFEKTIREAILALRWEKQGEGPNPSYFVRAETKGLQLEVHAASFVAHFITTQVAGDTDGSQTNSPDVWLDKYSLEIIASYLEDHGYIVTSPE